MELNDDLDAWLLDRGRHNIARHCRKRTILRAHVVRITPCLGRAGRALKMCLALSSRMVLGRSHHIHQGLRLCGGKGGFQLLMLLFDADIQILVRGGSSLAWTHTTSRYHRDFVIMRTTFRKTTGSWTRGRRGHGDTSPLLPTALRLGTLESLVAWTSAAAAPFRALPPSASLSLHRPNRRWWIR